MIMTINEEKLIKILRDSARRDSSVFAVAMRDEALGEALYKLYTSDV